MKLSVIIVSYKVKFYLEQCLLAVKKATAGIESEIYVVDNHSNDGSVEFIAERFPDINLISSNHNNGFSHANNIAIRQCSGEYVLLLNPDTIVGERSIKEVLKFMDAHPKAGGVGVKMLNADGSCAKESRRGVPTVATSFYKMTGLCACYPHSQRFAHYYMGHLPWDKSAQIEIISGAFCMLRHSAIDKIGLLDEDFFMYGEDVDLSYRLLKGGYENWYVPVEILHYKGESAHKSSFRYVHVFYNAMLIFFRKHYGHLSFLLSLPIKAAVVGKAALTLMQVLWWRAVKDMGLLARARQVFPTYLFIGREESIAACRTIAQKKALTGEFRVADHKRLPDGHLALTDLLPQDAPLVVVYDITAYSFDQIFEIFGREPRENVLIGTYNPSTQLIITGNEII